MRILNAFKRLGKKKSVELEAHEIVENIEDILASRLDKKVVDFDSVEDRTNFVKDNCEQIIETGRQVEESKVEYQLVTSYLMDMQKIERIPVDAREELDEAARKIITLSRDRAKYQGSDSKITDIQFKHMQKYEDEITTEIKKVQEKETYHLLIKNDMRQLEGEKASLFYEKKEIIAKQLYLKGLAMITSVLTILLFVLFATIAYFSHTDMTIPYIMSVTMAMVCVAYIVFHARKNQFDVRMVERKLNRAIGILNKVKIKYINNKSSLDYSYSKFVVNSSQELEYLWEQYLKAKEAANRYKTNSELLHFYNENLIRELQDYKVADPEVWIYQAVAIIDNKEMVEVRHRLNVRRQRLRELIEYNAKLKENSLSELKKVVKKYPNLRAEIITILSTYNIIIKE